MTDCMTDDRCCRAGYAREPAGGGGEEPRAGEGGGEEDRGGDEEGRA